MPAKLLTTSLAAPGFYGLNTQESIVSIESGFATVATNCVIDKYGRIGARKGWSPVNAFSSALGENDVEALGELVLHTGSTVVFAAGNSKLFKVNGGTLSELTYGGGGTAPTITANNWSMAALNNVMYFYQLGHDPLLYDPSLSTTTYRRVSEHPLYHATVSANNVALSAYGRIWTINNTTNKDTLQFSDILAGYKLSTGTAGTLDLSSVWPNGADEAVALAAHNGFLIIFGRRQILIYNNPQVPSSMALQDAITGVGCVARDSVVNTGTDVFFLSDGGLRALSRIIQEKSMPMRDISMNVRDELVGFMTLENMNKVRATHSNKEAFYLLSLPTAGITYCFDLRNQLPNGSHRATSWDGDTPTAYLYKQNEELYMGKTGYIGLYDTYLDNTSPYVMKYYTTYFDFQSPTSLKIMKKVGVTTIGGQGYPVVLKFGYDYTDILGNRQFSVANVSVAEYNISEYNIAEFGGSAFDHKLINIGGAGNVIQLGFETVVNGRPFSIQKLDVYAKIGKTK